ncbi:hypothetical protein [Actinoplanes sp. URMC 104]|uniref:hypothetical protein n=1 Tax=Actinoplanes sp. URMC 104 TaxID=3423409 RepID=UPI003F1E2837
MEPARSLRDVLADLTGAGGAAGDVGDPLGGLPGELVAEAVVSYADTAPAEVAEHLAPFVTAHTAAGSAADPGEESGWLDLLLTAPTGEFDGPEPVDGVDAGAGPDLGDELDPSVGLDAGAAPDAAAGFDPGAGHDVGAGHDAGAGLHSADGVDFGAGAADQPLGAGAWDQPPSAGVAAEPSSEGAAAERPGPDDLDDQAEEFWGHSTDRVDPEHTLDAAPDDDAPPG